jgi:hypothetical protein
MIAQALKIDPKVGLNKILDITDSVTSQNGMSFNAAEPLI